MIGLNTSLVPMYISEIAPLNLRGGLGTVNQLAVTVGLLLSQVLGIEQILGTDEGWPVLLGECRRVKRLVKWWARTVMLHMRWFVKVLHIHVVLVHVNLHFLFSCVDLLLFFLSLSCYSVLETFCIW
jgi:hypothetical protein